MNFEFDNVYLNNTSVLVGPYEAKGPYRKYYDKCYNNLSLGMKTFEEAEVKLTKDSIDTLLRKENINISSIDLHIGGDLLNQIVATSYASKEYSVPFIGIYAACATSTLSLIIASNMISSNQAMKILCTTSSNNASAEKQFRYPNEYGGPKKKVQTFTTTGGVSALVSNERRGVKIESGTIGKVIDLGYKDVNNMGAVMAPAAASTLYEHLKYHNRKPDYYDLILTGDLGVYGKKIFLEYAKKEYGLDLNNYEDAGSIIYNINQPTYAGGSGPACLPIVAYSYIFDKMKKGEYKKVLLIATGSLHNTTMCNQKKSIPSIAHAVSLEAL